MHGSSSIAGVLLDLLLPRTCLECSSEGALLCDGCGGHAPSNLIVLNDGHLASISYGDHRRAQLLHAWKYGFDASARDILLSSIHAQKQAIVEKLSALGITHLIPIPLHARRKCERGFNQAGEIAAALSEVSNIPVLEALKRPVYAKQQMKKTKEERIASSAALFELTVPLPAGAVALIVDDVRSTGATLKSAADATNATSFTYTLFANE
jgi:predicted amidophosphoribosyltransferase